MEHRMSLRLAAIVVHLTVIVPLSLYWNQITAFVAPGLHPGIRAASLVLLLAANTAFVVWLAFSPRDE